jgi:hypothetical protein
MKAEVANPSRLNIHGNGDWLSDREILTAMLKRWRQKLGYCSIFAAVPAILASHTSEARSDEAKKPEASVAGRSARLLERLNMSCSNPALLKRQSEFRLPHQKGSFDMLAALAGNDDCPGRTVPGGTYTAVAAYTESGDTTGANDTVTRLQYYYYYTFDALGPDHVYSFTLTGRGPNPQIQVSTTSGTYKPLIYVLQGGFAGACPAGTGNTAFNLLVSSGSAPGGTATIDSQQMNFLPLNVPLHLFVDSALNDASGSGPYRVRIQDVTIAPTASTNPIDGPGFFVRQHYLDFLNRQADDLGVAFWTNEITLCGSDQACIEHKRINVSAAFYLSIEFQETGYLVERIYKAAYGDANGNSTLGGSHALPVPVIRLSEFLPDTQAIGNGVVVNQTGWEQVLENNKQSFLAEFVQRSRFTTGYPTTMTPAQFVAAFFTNAAVTPSASELNAAVNEFGGAANTNDTAARARALRLVAENAALNTAEFNRAFVLMQYFGYLRRNPNDAPDGNYTGYDFWLTKLNQFNGSYTDAEMVKAFIVSGEYRGRFEP